MRFNKKEYIMPQTTVLAYEVENLLAALSSTGEDKTGGEESGPGSGGPSSTPDVGSKENSGSLWDFDGDEY